MTITPVAGLRFERYCKDITPDGFLRQKIERFFWRDFSGEEFRRNITPVAGLIFETKNRAIFLERFFWRDFSGTALLSVQLCFH